MPALVGSGVIGSNLLEDGGVDATIVSMRAPHVLKNIWKILLYLLSSSIIGGSVYSSS